MRARSYGLLPPAVEQRAGSSTSAGPGLRDQPVKVGNGLSNTKPENSRKRSGLVIAKSVLTSEIPNSRKHPQTGDRDGKKGTVGSARLRASEKPWCGAVLRFSTGR
jgi:hypothetical protein